MILFFIVILPCILYLVSSLYKKSTHRLNTRYIVRCTAVLILITNIALLTAQDIHFSQYNGSLINLNPANTGFFDGNYRINGIYRSQWTSVPVPYRSISFAADGRFKTKKMTKDCFGVGIVFNNDGSAITNYNTNQIYLSGSYIHSLNKDSTLLWSTGLTAGISNNSFNYNKMTFDDQYQNSTYNSSNNTGENFSNTATTLADINLGTLFQYTLKQRAFVQYGISYHHVNSPKISFQNNSNIKIDSKLTNYLSFQYPIAPKIDILIEALYSHQGKYNEIVPGAQFKFLLEQKNNQAISVGAYYRLKDAAIARIVYQFKTLTAGIAYDVNMSKFKAATNSNGAFEFYVTYIFKKVTPFVPKTRVCPIYM